MVIHLERGADLHMAQLMPLPLTVSYSVLPFWYWLTWVVPDKGPLNWCVCVCSLLVYFDKLQYFILGWLTELFLTPELQL